MQASGKLKQQTCITRTQHQRPAKCLECLQQITRQPQLVCEAAEVVRFFFFRLARGHLRPNSLPDIVLQCAREYVRRRYARELGAHECFLRVREVISKLDRTSVEDIFREPW